MAITEMIVPALRRGSLRARGANAVADTPLASAAGTASWNVWGTTAYVTVTDPAALPVARRLVGKVFTAAEKAGNRFRPDAELHKLYRAAGRALTVSPMLADLVSAALVAAERTDGDVDPTVAAAMTVVHSGFRPGRRDRSSIPTCGSPACSARPVPGWREVHLLGRQLQVPAGTTLDLSATARAVACDRAAVRVRDRLGVGVLVGLGGDAATAGPAPQGGWLVEIEDRAGSRPAVVRLPAGAALATSHFTARTMHPDGANPVPADGADPVLGIPGHLIDPHTGQAPAPVWRMASVIGFSGLEAATYTSAALIRGTSARGWLTQLWVPARLITMHDQEITVASWADHLPSKDAAGSLIQPISGTADPNSFPAPRVANPKRTTL